MRLPPALGMPVAILWEQKGEKGPLGQPSTEPGMASQPGARKISGCFARASFPSLLLQAAQLCSHLPSMPLPYRGAAINHRAPSPLEMAGAGLNPTQPQLGTTTPALHPVCPSGAAVAVAVARQEGGGELSGQLS